MAPLLVVEGSVGDLTVAVEQVTAAGWRIRPGWDVGPPAERTGLVLVGVVADATDASEAMLAAITGIGLVVHGRASREVLDRLCDDLRRLGRVDHRPGGERRVPRFDEFDSALLGLLAAGLSVRAAAAKLYVSRRTADRRLADVRARLGVDSTAEALLAFRAFRDQPPAIEPAPDQLSSTPPPG